MKQRLKEQKGLAETAGKDGDTAKKDEKGKEASPDKKPADKKPAEKKPAEKK